jgi:hypothetical protein
MRHTETMLIVLFLAILIAMAASSPPTRTVSKIYDKKYSWMLDEEEMLKQSSFAIKPKKLISICKDVIDRNIGLDDPNDLAEDFVFQFPVVGPLNKAEYTKAVGGFKLKDMFPDLNPAFCDFRVDPIQPNRVWYTSYFTATHTGEGVFGKPTGTAVECPPQTISLTFNDQGQVIKYTGGYVMDRHMGNSGGMGGVFGPLYAIGRPLPFPEGKPYSPSLRYRFFTWIGNQMSKFQK